MNKVFFIGFIKDVELKFVAGSGKAVANYRISIPRQYKQGEKTEWDNFNCVTWNGQAEFLANNQDRIKKLLVEGRIQVRQYEKDGEKRYITEVITTNIEVVEWKDKAQEETVSDSGYEDMTPVNDGSDNSIPF